MTPANERLRPRFLPDREVRAEWGGKGATLARLIRAGFRVPPTACFGQTQIQDWLESLPQYASALREWRAWSATAPVALAALREAVLSAPVPEHLMLSADTLRVVLAGEQFWPMILRSSANIEDSAEASLAGCFTSVVVNDPDGPQLWAALRQVVASTFSEAAARRVLASGVDPRCVRMAVVVQPMLEAKLSGVCFSRDPSNPWNADGLVEWVEGTGESMVQGTGVIHSARAHGAIPGPLAPLWAELWERAGIAERLLDAPADLEWVWDGEVLWFVQARAVATEEARLFAAAPSRRWTRELTLERFPEALTSMGWTCLQDAFRVNLQTLERRFGVIARHPDEVAVAVRGTVYSDPRFFSFPDGVSVRWRAVLAPWKRAPWAALGAVVRFARHWLRGSDRAVAGALLKLELADAFLGSQAHDIASGWDLHREGSLRLLAAHESELTESTLDNGQAVLAAMKKQTQIGVEFMEPDLAVYLIKDTTAKALEALWRALGFDSREFPDLVRLFDGNRTLEMNAEWNTCAAALHADPAFSAFRAKLEASRDFESGAVAATLLAEPARAHWERFLLRNGHCTTSWDIALPVWSENPSRLVPLLDAAARGPGAHSLDSKHSRPLRAERRRQLFDALAEKGFFSAARSARIALVRLEEFMRIDEEHHFLSGMLLRPARRLILQGGKTLVALGTLPSPESVFHLKLDELKQALASLEVPMNFTALTERRASEFSRASRSIASFELPPVPSAPAALAPNGAWQGLPMSPGTATGIAVVVEHIEDALDLQPGTILVTTSPNPSLTPLYPQLGGIITITGGALSHGFVSAREYALPAVSGIASATTRIPPGARVSIDGTTGQVRVLPPSDPASGPPA